MVNLKPETLATLSFNLIRFFVKNLHAINIFYFHFCQLHSPITDDDVIEEDEKPKVKEEEMEEGVDENTPPER